LVNLEGNLTQLQQVVKNGQVYMEKLRSETGVNYDKSYSQQSQAGDFSGDFRLD